MSKLITVGATALFAGILCATPLSVRLSPKEPWRCSRTAPQRRLVVRSLQEAWRVFIAGHIGAHIGVGTTITMDTDTGHTSHHMDMD